MTRPLRIALPLLVLSACRATSKDEAPNTAPVVDAVRVQSDRSDARAGATLTCEVSAFDPDGDTLTPTYAWTVAGVAAGAGPTLLLSPGVAQVGDAILCTATVTDPSGATASGDASLTYVNSAPAIAQVAIDPSDGVTSDSTLTCSAEATDPDGDAPTVRYAWRNQTTGAALGDTAELALTPDTAAPDDVIACTVQVTDADGATASDGATVTVSNRAPTLTALTVEPAAPFSYEPVRCAGTGGADPDGDRVALAYAWRVDGVDAGTGDTLAPPFAVGATLTCVATISDGRTDGATTYEASVTVAGTPPVLGGVTLGAEPAYNDSTLTCGASATDVDGDAPTLDYAWSNDTRGVSYPGSDTFTLDASLAEPGDSVTCTVTAIDAQGMSDAGSATVTLANRAPSAGTVALSPDPATASDTLLCEASGAVDPDGDAVALSYAFTVDGAPAGGDATLASAFERDQAVTCTVTANDGRGGTGSASDTLVVSDTPPTISGLTLLPASPTTADVLYAEVATADTDGDDVALTYRWQVNGAVVGTDATLPAGAAARGDVVTLTVTPTDGTLEGAAATAEATIGNAAPAIGPVTLAPAVVYTNGTLTASVDASDADGDTLAYTYDWYVDGTLVQSGASATLDGVASFERDDTVYVVVTADDGTDVSAASSTEVAIANTAPTAPAVALTPADAVDGDDLTCSIVTGSTDADADDIAYTFAWTVDGAAYTGAADSATASVVSGVDVAAGQTWACSATATDGTDGTAGAVEAVVITDACYDSATFTVSSTARSELETVNAAVKDVDDDGYDDILFVNQLSSSVTIWWGGASGARAAETTLSMGRVGYGVDAGDLNGDGYPEVVASNQDYSRFVIAWGTGPRTFGSTSNVSQSGFPQGVTLVDADRDGDLDIVSTLGSSGCTNLRPNAGTGTFASGGCWVTDTYQKRAIDVDGDGYDELVSSGNGAIYSTASGSPVRSATLSLGATGTSNAIYPYDVDADGDTDLVVAEGSDYSLNTFKNDGTGVFGECDDTGALSYWPYAVGDLDADGDLDFVSVYTCSYCSSTWRIGLMD